MNKCRVCFRDFFTEQLLQYKNMPKAAQFMPTVETLKDDVAVELEVCQCTGCGLVQLSNAPVPYYKEVVRSTAFSEEMGQFRMKQFKDFVSRYALKNKKIIEIGCGKGEYLSIMQEAGVEAYGVEYSENSVQECVANGLRVSRQFIESADLQLQEAPFDAFFMMSFLEHLPDPNTVLQGINRNLCDGGVGLIEVPNFDMIIRSNLFSEFIGDHLFYFTQDTLCRTLSSNGFEVLECDSVWYDYIISAKVRKRRPLKLDSFRKEQNKIKKELSGYISKFPEKQVAIWGAGHQSLAVIALANVQTSIRYVVDSATFKQGKFTPATHIPIVSPRELQNNPVEAIIIIAAAYSNEVLSIVQNDYANIKHVSVLEDDGLRVVY